MDIYLARAGFCQLLIISVGGALLNEVIHGEPNYSAVSITLTGVAALLVRLQYLYNKARSLSKKSKKSSK